MTNPNPNPDPDPNPDPTPNPNPDPDSDPNLNLDPSPNPNQVVGLYGAAAGEGGYSADVAARERRTPEQCWAWLPIAATSTTPHCHSTTPYLAASAT